LVLFFERPQIRALAPDFVPALGTEFRAGRNFGGAFGTFGRNGQFFAALGAKFRAVSFGAALGAHELMVAFHVDLFPALLAFETGPFLHHFHFALRARGVDFHLGVRRTIPAEAFVRIPATVAGVTHATAAAMKMVFGLLDGGGKRLVMRLAVTGLGQALGDVAGFIDQAATKHSRRTAEPIGRLAAAKGNKVPAPGIVATLAVKLKLEPGVGAGLDGMIGKIFAKMDFAHDAFFEFCYKVRVGQQKIPCQKIAF
jgi:hypothetical protein